MSKFNPGLQPQMVAHKIRRLKTRQLDRAIRRFADYFNVDNDLEEVVACGEWWGYQMGNSHRYVFMVQDGSEYASIAWSDPELLDLAISNETDNRAVLLV
jgi:hypothetical protein